MTTATAPSVRRAPPALGDGEWRIRVRWLLALGVLSFAGMLLARPIPQNPAYHAFCDTRSLLGVPNALNVLSNLPFLAIGAMGLAWLARRPDNLEPGLRAAWAIVFACLAATAAGSAWYHLAPTNATLVWDRLPIAVAFMALYAAVVGERVSLAAVRWLLPAFVVFGGASVIVWHITDDLRLYALSQFYPIATIPVILALFPPRYSLGLGYIVGIGFYAVAKIFEELDLFFFGFGTIVSGHTLKHLTAAVGSYWILRMLRRRCRLISHPEARP